jgi:hypothetical protein
LVTVLANPNTICSAALAVCGFGPSHRLAARKVSPVSLLKAVPSSKLRRAAAVPCSRQARCSSVSANGSTPVVPLAAMVAPKAPTVSDRKAPPSTAPAAVPVNGAMTIPQTLKPCSGPGAMGASCARLRSASFISP